MKTMMTRTVNDKQRYYTLELFDTLFGESLIIRTYGSSSRLKPAGEIKELFPSFQEARIAFDTLIIQKHKRGYLLANAQIHN